MRTLSIFKYWQLLQKKKKIETLCNSNKVVCQLDPTYGYHFIVSDLEQQFSKCGPETSVIITFELVRNANSWAYPKLKSITLAAEPAICHLTNLSSDSDVAKV